MLQAKVRIVVEIGIVVRIVVVVGRRWLGVAARTAVAVRQLVGAAKAMRMASGARFADRQQQQQQQGTSDERELLEYVQTMAVITGNNVIRSQTMRCALTHTHTHGREICT